MKIFSWFKKEKPKETIFDKVIDDLTKKMEMHEKALANLTVENMMLKHQVYEYKVYYGKEERTLQ